LKEKPGAFFHRIYSEALLILSNTNNITESAYIGLGYELETKSGYKVKAIPKIYHENLFENFSLSEDTEIPLGKYTFFNLNTEFSTPSGNSFSSQAGLIVGSFYDGWEVSISANPRWSVSSTLELEGNYEFNHVSFPSRNQQFKSHITRLHIIYMLNTKFFAMAFIQYNSAIDSVIANFRIRYNPREGVDLYLVYNEAVNSDRNRAIMLKYTYTFNMN